MKNSDKMEYDLYLLIGQSNMAGRGYVEEEDTVVHPRVCSLNKECEWIQAKDPLHWDKTSAGVGPGLTIGRILAANNPDKTIGLIPCAHGGSNIEAWQPGEYWEQTDAHPWDDMVRRVEAALNSGTVKGIFWHQGESNSGLEKAPLYRDQFVDLVQRIRTVPACEDVPFVAGTLGDHTVAKSPGADIINRDFLSLKDKLDLFDCIETAGAGCMEDNTHFTAAAQRELGKRYAAAMIELQKSIRE